MTNAEFTDLDLITGYIRDDVANARLESALRLLQQYFVVFKSCPSAAACILDDIVSCGEMSSDSLRLRALLGVIVPEQISNEAIFRESLELGNYELACQLMPKTQSGLLRHPFFFRHISQNLLSLLYGDRQSDPYLSNFLIRLTLYNQESLQSRLLGFVLTALLSDQPSSYSPILGRSVLERRILRRVDKIMRLLKTGNLDNAYSLARLGYQSNYSFPRIFRQLFSDIYFQIPSYAKSLGISLTYEKFSVAPNGLGNLGPAEGSNEVSESLSSLLSRAYFCSSASIVYIEIPKTASTSLLAAMALANGDCPAKDRIHGYALWLQTLRQKNKYLTRLSDIPHENALKILSDPSIKVISFIRNPIARFVSSFYDKIIANPLSSYQPWPRIFAFASSGKWNPDYTPFRCDICAFAEAMFSVPATSVEVHFRQQHLLLGIDYLPWLKIYELEDRVSMNAVIAQLGQDNSQVLNSIGEASPHSIPKSIALQLRKDLIDGGLLPALVDYYAMDLSLIGTSKNDLLGDLYRH